MKKSISILLTVCLLFTCFLLTASAAAPGDVDGDGAVSPADARFALRASVKLESPDAAEFAAADVDGDGVLTPSDARVILRISVRLEDCEEGSETFLAADVNRDGVIGPDDARLILRASVGLYE